MVDIAKSKFNDRLVAVSIPVDSGRNIAVEIGPSTGPVPVRSAWNIQDFARRLAWRDRLTQPFYTRDDIRKAGYEWIIDVVRAGGMAQYDRDCSAVKNGGPETIELGDLTVDDVEAIEIMSSARSGGPTTPRPGRQSRVSVAPSSNAAPAHFENMGLFCPLVYVWLR